MSELRELLQHGVSPVDAGPDPAEVWRAGRARRARRRAVRAVASALLVALVVLGALPLLGRGPALTPAARDGSSSGHPQRISSHRTRSEPLTAVAGVLSSPQWHPGPVLVDPTGETLVPQGLPPVRSAALSPDGSRVAYLVPGDDSAPGPQTPAAGLVVAGTTGRQASDPTRTDLTARPHGQLPHVDPGPLRWSPDSRRVALAVHLGDAPPADAPSVLVRDGSRSWLVGRAGAHLAGWRADGALLLWREAGAGRVTLDAVEAGTGRVLGSQGLDSDAGGSLGDVQTDPTGRLLTAVAARAERDDVTVVAGPLLPAGRPVTLTTRGVDAGAQSPRCVSWRGDRPLHYAPAERALRDLGSGEVVTVVDPVYDADCLQLTSAALAGPRHTSWFGTSTGWAAWHVREIGVGVLGPGILGLLLWSAGRLPRGGSSGVVTGGPDAWQRRRRGSVVTHGRDDDPWDQVAQSRARPRGPYG
ncbi:hypothetical protein [Arsenicicoccus dermatophilus]|uniref:hypothetical protein n=1 Tax=Arsenicicoccus dermatophilus TaxID=1076331 RepID=UPI0039173801